MFVTHNKSTMYYSVAHVLGSKPRSKDVLLPENEQTDFRSMLLPHPVLEGLIKAGFVQPSPIQKKAIPLARCGFDLIVQSKSGTGKTCVFTVAALDSLNIDCDRLQTIVIAPTREIAIQIAHVINAIGSHFPGLKVVKLIGGLPINEDKEKLKKACHIVVGTPGRIRHCMGMGWLDFSAVRLFVLDEADMLMKSSFHNDINEIFKELPDSKQVLACSATYTPLLVTFLGNYMQSATHVTPGRDPCPVLLGLRHFVLISPDSTANHLRKMKIKEDQLMSILKLIPFSQCLVFSNYQTRAESVCQMLRRKGWSQCCEWIAGCQDQYTRINVYERVRDFKTRILLTTDLTARGLDFEAANLVINLDIPSDPHTYLHRMGRAGRFGGHGIVITLLTTDELSKFRILMGKIGSFAKSYVIPEKLLNKELWTADLGKFETIEGIEDTEQETVMSPCPEIEVGVQSESNDEAEVKNAMLSEFGLKLLRFQKSSEFRSFQKLRESCENYITDNRSKENDDFKWRKVLEPPGSLDYEITEHFLSVWDKKSARITEKCTRTPFVEALKWSTGDGSLMSTKEELINYGLNFESPTKHVDVCVKSEYNKSDCRSNDVPSQSVASCASSTSSSDSSSQTSSIQSFYEILKDSKEQQSLSTEENCSELLDVGAIAGKTPIQIFVPKRKSCYVESSSSSTDYRHEKDNSEHIDEFNDECNQSDVVSSYPTVPEEKKKRSKPRRKKKKSGSLPLLSDNQAIDRTDHYRDVHPTADALKQWHELYAQQMSHIRWYANYAHYMNRMLNYQNYHS